ncbi:MAG: class I SAM-dependent methyltransferase [Desulfobacteraceae bacterium]|nr:class I SAM-dependent methyltransferase [Desulfobacteraceae bacterium]MBC2754848.1 class I SAM-dependent methyltransferase [Desulfobacteraceae bacterium]
MDGSLSERQKKEEAYHDNIYKNGAEFEVTRIGGGEYYDYFWKAVGDVDGKNILDFGCGNGWVSIKYAKNGAHVWGFDISGELIEKAKKWIMKEGLSESITLEKMAAENLAYEDNFFDLIVGSAILHHTELDITLKNIDRVLKPDGKAIFIEPMNQNIFLQLWRKMTPNRRSPTERALTKSDLLLIEHVFPRASFTFFGFLSIFTAGLLVFSPQSRIVATVNNWLDEIDRHIFQFLPFLGRFGAVIVLELKKG